MDKHYYSNDLLDALKNIIIQSENGEEQIIALFHETGIYKLAEEAITDNKDAHDYWYISQLLEKYDSDNIDGWLMDWKYGPKDMNLYLKCKTQIKKSNEENYLSGIFYIKPESMKFTL